MIGRLCQPKLLHALRRRQLARRLLRNRLRLPPSSMAIMLNNPVQREADGQTWQRRALRRAQMTWNCERRTVRAEDPRKAEYLPLTQPCGRVISRLCQSVTVERVLTCCHSACPKMLVLHSKTQPRIRCSFLASRARVTGSCCCGQADARRAHTSPSRPLQRTPGTPRKSCCAPGDRAAPAHGKASFEQQPVMSGFTGAPCPTLQPWTLVNALTL